MGKMKELFMKYQEEIGNDSEFIDDDYSFQQWCEQREKEEKEYWEQFSSGSVHPSEMIFYSDYEPTPEEEEEAFKLFNNQK